MKVTGTGFGRTGTMSLKIALDQLSEDPCLNPLKSLAARGIVGGRSHWERLAEGGRVDLCEASTGWGSTVD